MYRSRRYGSPLQWKQNLVLYGLLAAFGFVIFGFLASFIIFAWYGRNLPSPGKLSEGSSESTIFYDRDGKVLYEISKDKNRVPVAATDISKYLKQATVSIEDKNFYKHQGISQTGIIRAFLSTLLGRGVQGGSTITQQLIKNTLLTSERTLSRKVKEVILASEVERKYTKDEILGMYLNEAPYGGNYYGVGAAAKGYFDKDPKDLNLMESAILAGLPQSPSQYSPYIGVKDAWRGRAKDVLRRMREDGYITSQQEKTGDAQINVYTFSAPKVAITAPHYVFYVRNQIENEYGAAATQHGIKVKTTIDSELQKDVEKIVYDEISSLKSAKVGNGAVVILDSKTGAVLAYVGSYDFNNDEYGKFDVASAGMRQPGSALKPIIYTLAFERGYTPSTALMDVKTNFFIPGQPDFAPVNYDGKFHGPMQLRFALGNSMNIPAVKLLSMVGIKDFMEKAYEAGLSTYQPTDENLSKVGLSIALGGGETTLLNLTSAYTVFATGGIKRDVQLYSEISDFKGKKLFKATKPLERRVFSPEATFLTSHILSDNNARSLEFGPNSYLNIPGKTVAVKTGTTNDKRDNWAIGYTNDISVGVWVGNNDNSPMDPRIASGLTGASSIWYKVMIDALKKYSDGIMSKPDKVKALQIDAYLGGLPKDGQPTRSEYFIDGSEPKSTSPFYKKLKISRADHTKLANDVEIHQGNYDEKEYIVFTESDPLSTDGKNRWQEGIDDWIKSQPDEKFHPPTEVSSTNSDDVLVSLNSPSDHTTIGSDVEIKAHMTSVAAIQNVKIYINGTEIKNFDGDTRDIDEHISLQDGVYEIKVSARNEKGKSSDSTVHVGVNKPWDTTPTPTPS